AAYVAGLLSLEDACKVVVLRSRLIGERLAGLGGMLSVAVSEREAVGRIEAGVWGGVEVAAVNSPGSVVVAGPAEAVERVQAVCEERGVRARRIPVDYASHTTQVEQIRAELAEVLEGLSPRDDDERVPLLSTVTGRWVSPGEMDGGYWFRNLRRPVRFAEAVDALAADGYGVFVEVSAHPVLTVGVEEAVEAAGGQAVVTGTLRRDQDTLGQVLTSLAQLHVNGVGVDWTPVLGAVDGSGGGALVSLPTYAFQRERYWLDAPTVGADASGLGLEALEHSLLGAAVPLAEGGQLFTGRISLETHPWLADHQVLGSALVPPAALVELVIRAGDQVGCGRVEELTLEAPLVLPEQGGVQVQVVVEEPDEAGLRPVAVYSHLEDATGSDDAAWSSHATGLLVAGESAAGDGVVLEQWPPVGAEVVMSDPEGFYAGLAERGFGYGPAFRGLESVWRRGEEVFAQVRLPQERVGEMERFEVHPALLDAVLHAVGLADFEQQLDVESGSGSVRVPFAWSGVRLHASGASVVRVRLTRAGSDAVALEVADAAGRPVVSIESLALRPISAEQLQAAQTSRYDSLFQLDWQPVAMSAPVVAGGSWTFVGPDAGLGEAVVRAGGRCASYADVSALISKLDEGEAAPETVVLSCPTGGGDEGLVAGVRESLSAVLSSVRRWLGEERLLGSRLVVATCGAVATEAGEDVAGLVQAPVWGLLRSVQTENPGRFLLLDHDPDHGSEISPTAADVVVRFLAAGEEPQLAVRGATVLVPRLSRVAKPAAASGASAPLVSGGTVLVTGASGVLAGVVARHLVAERGVEH
ncbi:acyltransferase domain-containing protein, partial [Streptomyces javensis]|uniref:acyltransferase domain-containing protein n=1 Tax=Streptomyces javensis TaxID=114698 RepID=UPI00340BA2B8